MICQNNVTFYSIAFLWNEKLIRERSGVGLEAARAQGGEAKWITILTS